MRRRTRVFLFLVAGLVAGLSGLYFASSEVRYLARAGLEETRILKLRRPIADVARDPGVSDTTRAYLALVLDVRAAAARYGLEAKETYTQYTDIGRDTLLLSLTVAPKDCICPYTWKYPIVGTVPYKGYFDFAVAKREAARFDAKGYDTSLRPAAAFSTLGWFNDPLLSTALVRDSVELAALVFHEIAHNTLYVRSATAFNESFAQLVGYRAAETYFRARGDTALARKAADRWHDEQVLGDYYADLIARLDSVYRARPAGAALDSARVEAGRWARAQLEARGDQLRTYTVGRGTDRPVNNARLIGVLLYRTKLREFERWFQQQGADISRAVAELRTLEQGAAGEEEAFRRMTGALR